jgi:toxin HigB-1
MIISFSDKSTERLMRKGECDPRWQNIKSVALRKLDMLDAAISPNDMRAPPGNRLERLKGNRLGQWSIRINDQWRICFVWRGDGPEDVEIVDYH